MGLWDTVKDRVTNAAQDFMGKGKDQDMISALYKRASDFSLISASKTDGDARSDWWTINPESWYQVYPYQFVVHETPQKKANGDGKGFMDHYKAASGAGTELAVYTLPIPPQALNIKMVQASSVTPTLGGVVEETSANVFWDISLSGTTGIAIGKDGGRAEQQNPRSSIRKTASIFRDTISSTGELAGFFGSLSKSAAKLGGIADRAVSAYKSGDVMGGIAGASGAVQDALLPTPLYTSSAVRRNANGFVEMQEMHRFLLVYSRMKGAFPEKFFMKFRMYKTGQEWMCSVRDFNISQNASNPHLYKYSIQLRCWSVQGIGKEAQEKAAADRFGVGGDLAAVNIVTMKQGAKGLSQLFRGGRK